VPHEKKGGKYLCPLCQEWHLEINERTCDFRCWSRDCQDKTAKIAALIRQEVRKREAGPKPAAGKEEEPEGSLTLVEYAMAKQLSVQYLQDFFGVFEAKHPFYRKVASAVCFPYLNERGEEVNQQWRWGMGNGKRRYLPRKPTYLYGGKHLERLERMAADGKGVDAIFLVEGESNTHTLSQCFPTLGLPGVLNWQPERAKLRLFEQAKRIYFFLDMVAPDGPPFWMPAPEALKGARKVAECFPAGKVLAVKLPCKDVSDLWKGHLETSLQDGPDAFLHDLKDAILEAAPVIPRIEVVQDTQAKVEDMPEAVLDGRLGKVYRERMSDFPIAYAWPALLTAAAPFVPHARDGGVRSNLFVTLVGDKGSGKSQAFEHAFQLLGLKEPLLSRLRAGSFEGLADQIGDAAGEGRLVYLDELEHLMKKAGIENASFAPNLNSIFNHDGADLTVRRGRKVTLNARLSVAGGVITERFSDLFGEATTGGLHDRFIFGHQPTGIRWSYRPFDEGRPVFTMESNDDDGTLLNPGLPSVEIEPDVWRELRRWEKEMGFDRVSELALRVAVISAAFDERRILKADDLGPALAFAQYQQKIRVLLQPNPGKNQEAQCANRIRQFLERHAPNGQWVTVRQVNQHTSGSKDFGGGIFERALHGLNRHQEIELTPAGEKPRKVRLCKEA